MFILAPFCTLPWGVCDSYLEPRVNFDHSLDTNEVIHCSLKYGTCVVVYLGCGINQESGIQEVTFLSRVLKFTQETVKTLPNFMAFLNFRNISEFLWYQYLGRVQEFRNLRRAATHSELLPKCKYIIAEALGIEFHIKIPFRTISMKN